MLAMRLNENSLKLIKEFETLVLKAYQDEAGVWTIGWGHTGPEVKPGLRWTEDQANKALKRDLDWAKTAVGQMIGDSPTSGNQFGAMVSLCFNIGSGGFSRSSVRRFHVDGEVSAAASAFLMWCKVRDPETGKLRKSNGLLRRRSREKELYLRAD